MAWKVVKGKKFKQVVSYDTMSYLVRVINGIQPGTSKEEIGKRIGQALSRSVSWSTMAGKFNQDKLIACLEELFSSFPSEVLSIATVAFMVDDGSYNIQLATHTKLGELGISHIGRVNMTPAPAPAPALAPASASAEKQTKGAVSDPHKQPYKGMALAGSVAKNAKLELVYKIFGTKVKTTHVCMVGPIEANITSGDVINLMIKTAEEMRKFYHLLDKEKQLREGGTMGNSTLTVMDTNSKEEKIKLFALFGNYMLPVCMEAIFDNREQFRAGMSPAEAARLATITELAAPKNHAKCALQYFCHNPLCNRVHEKDTEMEILLRSLSAVGCIRSLLGPEYCGVITPFPEFQGRPKNDDGTYFEIFGGKLYVLPQ